VRWEECNQKDDTWEPYSNLLNVKDEIKIMDEKYD
jgi:hypothetical protein